MSESFMDQLKAEDSQLILIFSSAKDKVSEAQFLQEEMSSRGYSFAGSILNRAYNLGLDQGLTMKVANDSCEEQLKDYFGRQKRESERCLKLLQKNDPSKKHFYALVPEIRMSLENQSDILDFSSQIEETWTEIL